MSLAVEPKIDSEIAAAKAEPVRSWPAILHDWVTTVDHKKIGLMYIGMAIFYLVVGGCEALLIRWQLFYAHNNFLRPTRSTSSSRCTAQPWSSSWACLS